MFIQVVRTKVELQDIELDHNVSRDNEHGFGLSTESDVATTRDIRFHHNLLYGNRATLTVTENQPSGTVVTITVPYVVHAGSDGGATMAP